MKESQLGSALSKAKGKSSKDVVPSPGAPPRKGSVAASPEPEATKKEPVLDPHHLQLVQIGRKVKMVKYDKHPNVKKRRDYKDMVTVECTVECISKENERFTTDFASKTESNSRAGSKQSTNRKGFLPAAMKTM